MMPMLCLFYLILSISGVHSSNISFPFILSWKVDDHALDPNATIIYAGYLATIPATPNHSNSTQSLSSFILGAASTLIKFDQNCGLEHVKNETRSSVGTEESGSSGEWCASISSNKTSAKDTQYMLLQPFDIIKAEFRWTSPNIWNVSILNQSQNRSIHTSTFIHPSVKYHTQSFSVTELDTIALDKPADLVDFQISEIEIRLDSWFGAVKEALPLDQGCGNMLCQDGVCKISHVCSPRSQSGTKSLKSAFDSLISMGWILIGFIVLF